MATTYTGKYKPPRGGFVDHHVAWNHALEEALHQGLPKGDDQEFEINRKVRVNVTNPGIIIEYIIDLVGP
jgi:hypothetical protein